MIFQHTWQKVLSGQKTQTRRLARQIDKLWAVEHEDKAQEKVLLRGDRHKWRTGRTYAVQPGRNQPAIARIRLLDIRYQLLAHVSEAEARAEGYTGLEEFREMWQLIHGKVVIIICVCNYILLPYALFSVDRMNKIYRIKIIT